MRYLKYFVVQLKRVLRLAVGVFPTAMLLFACLGLIAYLFFTKSFLAEGKNKYQVGVVGKIDETYLGFGIQAVQSLDPSRFMVDFLPMTEKEAREKYLAGELETYIKVPDDFLDSLIYGRNDVPITYIQQQGQKGLTGYLMEELSKVVSKLVISSQGSIYAMQRVMIEKGQTDQLSKLTDVINYKLIEYVLGRTRLAELEELGFSKGLLIRQYYFCALVLCFAFLFGICGAPIFFGRNEQLPKWMKVRGIGSFAQVICEWMAYFMFLFGSIAVLLALLGNATGKFAFLMWKMEMGELIITLLPLTLMISAMQFMLYELFQNPVVNLLFQFVAVIGMGYVSGFFFPATFFPDAVVRFGRILPTGAAMEYFAGKILGEATGGPAAGILVYLLAFLAVAVISRTWKVHFEGNGI